MKGLILMLQFFTRLPLNVEIDVKPDSFTRGIVWFPVVGIVVGAIDAAVLAGAIKLLPLSVAVVLAVLCNVLVTGALHYDGLADTCDGVFSARSRERMLEIMKDSRIGTNGAIALLFDIGLKLILLSELPTSKAIAAIFVMTVLAKLMLALIIFLSKDHSKGSGLGSLFLGEINKLGLVMTLIAGFVVILLVLGSQAFVLLAANLIVMLAFRSYILKRLGVMTGDSMGALNELCEVVTLLVLVMLERGLLR